MTRAWEVFINVLMVMLVLYCVAPREEHIAEIPPGDIGPVPIDGTIYQHMFFQMHGVKTGIYIGYVDSIPRMWGESHLYRFNNISRTDHHITLVPSAVHLNFFTGGIDSLAVGETLVVRRVHI